MPASETPDALYFNKENITEFLIQYKNLYDECKLSMKNSIFKISRYCEQILENYIETWNK